MSGDLRIRIWSMTGMRYAPMRKNLKNRYKNIKNKTIISQFGYVNFAKRKMLSPALI